MKKFSAIFTAAAIFLFSSCNESTKNDKEEVKSADTVAAMATTPEPAPAPAPEPAFTPFKTVVIAHHVKDFSKWRAAYMSPDSMREAWGITHYRIGRGTQDSNLVVVIDKITDVIKAKEYGASATLKDVMKKAGVTDKPKISFYEVIRSDDSKAASDDRVSFTTKVKDFDAWLKVYDGEGKAKRAENGLVDRALARNIDDPNTVRIVFVVTDLAKAKARSSSEELKKLMTDSGVLGKPDIFWYKLVE